MEAKTMKVNDYPKEIERAALDLAATYEELSETRDRIKDAEFVALASMIAAKDAEIRRLDQSSARRCAPHAQPPVPYTGTTGDLHRLLAECGYYAVRPRDQGVALRRC